MNKWCLQDWKEILSKSGTTAISTDTKPNCESKDITKMVYYTVQPLKVEPHQSSQSHQTFTTHSTKLENASNNFFNHQSPSGSTYQLDSTDMCQKQSIQQSSRTVKPEYKCDYCNMVFGSKSAQTSHIKSHIKTARPKQSSSNESAGATNQLNAITSPIVSASQPISSDPYQCDVCKKTFAVPARLVRHYRTHTGERPFECEFCNKMFSVKENLQVHRRIHTKERPYKCDLCSKAFEHSGKLHRHMRIHTGERPHKCSVCEKTFIQSGQLVIHMRTHTGEKPYKCPVEGCGKGFTCSKQLKVHSRTHTGEKPYHCDICFRDFGYNHVLKLHRVQHYGSKCYKCTICDETFKSKKEMEAHIKGHANEMPDDEDTTTTATTDGGESITVPSQLSDSIKMERRAENNPTDDTQVQIVFNNIPSIDDRQSPVAGTQEINSSCQILNVNSHETDNSYYTTYSRYESTPSSSSTYGSNLPYSGGVNPALLAAVSLATNSSIEEDKSNTVTTSFSAPSFISSNYQHYNNVERIDTEDGNDLNFAYKTLASRKQQSYYMPPPPKVENFRSMEAANEIVKRVEAALANAEPLLTPPRSSPESPERSSSPDDGDVLLMANRDIMSLPPRKRKLYLQENTDDSPVRMSSVIQFARAS